MATNLDRASVVARQVELKFVSLQRADVISRVDPLDPPAELQLRQGYRAHYEFPSRHPGSLYVYVNLDFAASSGDVPEVVDQVTLGAAYLLVYTLKDGAECPADALQHFAELNGAYHIWPYWRELVQTVSGRVGLAAIVVPVFRPEPRNLEEEA